MADSSKPAAAAVVVPDKSPDLQTWDDDRRGRAQFRTLIDADYGPSRGLVQGITYLEDGDAEHSHSHRRPETIYVLSGEGKATVDDREFVIGAGDTVFVPAEIPHSWEAADGPLSFLYTFPADRFADVEYDFGGEKSGGYGDQSGHPTE